MVPRNGLKQMRWDLDDPLVALVFLDWNFSSRKEWCELAKLKTIETRSNKIRAVKQFDDALSSRVASKQRSKQGEGGKGEKKAKENPTASWVTKNQWKWKGGMVRIDTLSREKTMGWGNFYRWDGGIFIENQGRDTIGDPNFWMKNKKEWEPDFLIKKNCTGRGCVYIFFLGGGGLRFLRKG